MFQRFDIVKDMGVDSASAGILPCLVVLVLTEWVGMTFHIVLFCT